MENQKLDQKKEGIPIQVLSALVSRMALASQLGTQQYGGNRDIYQALGYKETISFVDYYGRYLRQDIAKAIIDRPVSVTWRGNLIIQESGDVEETDLEKAWNLLERKLGLKSKFARVDRLTGIGSYGVLLLGLDGVKTSEDFKLPATSSKQLLYVKPLSSESAKISAYETDVTNPRYGLPLLYQVTVQDVQSGITSVLSVHYSRVIHIVDDVLENEVEGAPRLQVVFNRLMDLEKLIGGDAEMYWRGARPGYTGKLEKDYQLTEETLADLQAQFDEYEHNLRRFLVNEGVDLQSLAQQIADPSTHVDIQIQMISAVTGIPKRVLTGSERGELSSAQDKGEWLEYVQGRREEYAEPKIIRPFVDRMIELGVLPKAKNNRYSIKWADLFSPSDKDKAEIAKTRAIALKEYLTMPTAADVIPVEAFLELFMGLTPSEVDLINRLREEQMAEEPLITEPEMEEDNNPPTIPPEEEPENQNV